MDWHTICFIIGSLLAFGSFIGHLWASFTDRPTQKTVFAILASLGLLIAFFSIWQF